MSFNVMLYAYVLNNMRHQRKQNRLWLWHAFTFSYKSVVTFVISRGHPPPPLLLGMYVSVDVGYVMAGLGRVRYRWQIFWNFPFQKIALKNFWDN